MRMDHYGRMVDALTEMWEALDNPDLIDEAAPVRKALEKAMSVSVTAERVRRSRMQAFETLEAMATLTETARFLRAA